MTAPAPRRRPRSGRSAAWWWPAALVCGLMVATAGCTSPAPQGPQPPPGTAGSAAPTTPGGPRGSGLPPPDDVSGTALGTATSPTSSGPPPAPAAATLSWLSGAADKDGIIVQTRQGKRWQGPEPGSYALLQDGGYSWFGPGGSMVGCTAKGRCVGVDEDGRVAVTTSHGSPRMVYDADGRFVGRFSAKGEQLPRPASVPSLPHEIASSGVDLAGLVNAATLAPPFAGGATGDPHLITAGGTRFTSQAAGQFVARGGDGTHAIQLQFEPMAHREDVSVVSAVAIGAGDDTVVVGMDGSLTINGTARTRESTFDQVTLASGVAIGRWPATPSRVVTVAVVWPDGGSVVMTANPALGITVVAYLYTAPGEVGLFGAAGKGTGSDLLSRDGTAPDTSSIVASWQVDTSERLFGSPSPGPSDFPEKAATLDAGARQMAGRACGGRGIEQAADLAACAFDVALTGDTGFVAGHLELALPAERGPVAADFAGHWPALLAGPVSDAPAMPADGRLRFTLGKGKSRTMRITLDHGGVVRLVNGTGCGLGESPATMGQPAMRLFDADGHAVSDRFAMCGHEQTPALPAGSYHLVVANGPAATLPVRVDVTLP